MRRFFHLPLLQQFFLIHEYFYIKRQNMDKTKSLEVIHNARKSYQQQMDKISAFINGNDIENPTAVSYTKCAFGKWLYDKAKLYYSELLETTGKLLKAMDSAQRRIAALKESTFN